MSPKEKAKELVYKMTLEHNIPYDYAKECALIAIDEQIEILSFILQELAATQARTCSIIKKSIEELMEVKQEIMNL